jgi:hypothetical protein
MLYYFLRQELLFSIRLFSLKEHIHLIPRVVLADFSVF